MTSQALEKALFQTLQQDNVPWELQPKFGSRLLLWGWKSWRADPNAVHICQICLKHVIQWLLVVLSVSWNLFAWIWCHLFTSLEANWLFLKKTNTQTRSPQVMISLLVGSKFILWTSLNIFILAKPILVRVKTAREDMWGTLFLSSLLKYFFF